MATRWVKKLTPYNDWITIQLYEEIQYSDGPSYYITVANKKPFNELKKNDLIKIDTDKIANYSSKDCFGEEDTVSKV